MLEIKQVRSGQFWISRPGETTYAVGASQAAKLLGYTIEDVLRLVVAVVQLDDAVIA